MKATIKAEPAAALKNALEDALLAVDVAEQAHRAAVTAAENLRRKLVGLGNVVNGIAQGAESFFVIEQTEETVQETDVPLEAEERKAEK